MAAKGELLRRLQALQTPPETALPDLTQYSLDEMANMKVTFGEKWKGSMFLQVWEQDQGYVAWFLGKYQGSTKLDHRLFTTFIEAMVDQAELRGHMFRSPRPPTHRTDIGRDDRAQAHHEDGHEVQGHSQAPATNWAPLVRARL